MKRYKTPKLVRMEHLNHHGNLYAGQAISWMVENAFIVASCEYDDPKGLLFRNAHKFSFSKSVMPGDIVYYEGTLVRTGKSSLTVRVGLYNELTGELHAEGFATLVTVDDETRKSKAHGIVLDETDDTEELKWREEAESYFK